MRAVDPATAAGISPASRALASELVKRTENHRCGTAAVGGNAGENSGFRTGLQTGVALFPPIQVSMPYAAVEIRCAFWL